jgi:hypothetical protein
MLSAKGPTFIDLFRYSIIQQGSIALASVAGRSASETGAMTSLSLVVNKHLNY